MKRLLLIGLCAATAAAAVGCEQKEELKKGEAPPPAIEPMGEGEAQVGRQACESYVAQVCACAPKQAELKDECEMAKARPNAFEMNTRAAMAQGDADTKDRRALVANARKIMRSCIEDGAALAKKGCPMLPPPGSEPAAPTPGAPAAPAPSGSATPAAPAAPASPAPAAPAKPAAPAPAPPK